MVYIVLDLEATCWEKGTNLKSQETIEIGALKLDHRLEKIGEFNRFIRPIEEPELSDFCIKLTHITQSDIDIADTYDLVFPAFLEWVGEKSYNIVSWGNYDIKQLRIDCKRHSLKFPSRFKKKHTNMKSLFAEKKNIKPCGMKQALKMMNMPLIGRHHRGIDDARNVTEIFRRLENQ